MAFDPLNPEQIVAQALQLQDYADSQGVNCNTIMMQQSFYEQDKAAHGSFKPYIGTPVYEPMMYGRHVRIFDKIRQTIDAKAKVGYH